MHVSINVQDLARSLAFYQRLWVGAIAAGRYLQQLRDYARLSRAEVATQVRALTGTATNDVQIFRIERGCSIRKARC